MAAGADRTRAEPSGSPRCWRGARAGAGAIVLLSGEAGVGKTPPRPPRSPAAPACSCCAAPRSRAARRPTGRSSPCCARYLHARPGGLDDCGPLRAHLALLLPELGDPAPAPTAPTCSRRCAARSPRLGPALVVLDDLQWSDEATLEVLAALAEPLADLPLLVLAAYRSDGLPRDHGVRRLRNELRRGGHLEELVLAPLDPPRPAQLLEAGARRRARAVAGARDPRPHPGRPVLRRGARRRAARERRAAPGRARARAGRRRRGPAARDGARRRADRRHRAVASRPARGRRGGRGRRASASTSARRRARRATRR